MLLEIIGMLMLSVSIYMNYYNIVIFNPLYSFGLQWSLSMLGTAIITRKIIHRKSKKKRRSR